ncbi:MAG: fasciclin domain-containing protein [Roseiflexaceae bacterium]|nr:fasciclin domain-containing protein [Roseiflexaceae bacterium]
MKLVQTLKPILALITMLVVSALTLAACGTTPAAQTSTAAPAAAPTAMVAEPTAMMAEPTMAPTAMMTEPTAMMAPTDAITSTTMASGTVADVAMADTQFSTLVELVIAADLPSVLNGPGPLTVFAPTNEAFAKLPQATLDALKADTAMLKAVLTYHVLPAKVTAADITGMGGKGTPVTANGAMVNVTTIDGAVYVNDAKVIKADVPAANGVIHVIDTVLIPQDMMAAATIGGTAMADPQFNTLSMLVTLADLGPVVKDPMATLTVFAPTDAAFAKLPKETVDALLADKEALKKVLLYHVLGSVVTSQDVAGMGGAGMPATVNGATVDVTTKDGAVYVNGAKVVVADIKVGNGVIHAIDTVLLPPDMR